MEKYQGFQDFSQWLKGAGIELWLMVAGFFGAIASISKDKQMNFVQQVLSVISGTAVANYLTPITTYLVKVPDKYSGAIAFILGLSGLKLVEWGIEKYKQKFDKKI